MSEVGNLKPPGRIAFAGPDVYLAGTTDLRRIKGLVTRQSNNRMDEPAASH